MNLAGLFILIFFLPGSLWSQEQLVLRLNEKGLLSTLKMAVRYNTSSKRDTSVLIPRNIYRFKLQKDKFFSSPVFNLINEVSNLDLTKDLEFFLATSDIQVQGDVDVESLKVKLIKSTQSYFDVNLSVKIPRIYAQTKNISLCEKKNKNKLECGKGLKATVSELNVKTFKNPAVINIKIRILNDKSHVRAKVLSVRSNLESPDAPKLNINLKSIEVPKISIVVGGVEQVLDTSNLKAELLNYKEYFASNLLDFVADFLAQDLVEMINRYLVNKGMPQNLEILDYTNAPDHFENLFDNSHSIQVDNTYYHNPYLKRLNAEKIKKDPFSEMLKEIQSIVRRALLLIKLKNISTPNEKDIEVSGSVGLVLNNNYIKVENLVGNSSRKLPSLNLSALNHHDINLAISEPLINSVLDVVNSTNLFQEVFEVISPVQGFHIKSVKLHFTKNNTIAAVVNSEVDLNRIYSKDLLALVKNKIAAFLERNNNNSILYFPIEFELIPRFSKNENGGAMLDVWVKSPFNGSGTLNQFKYPSNVHLANESVRDGVMSELKASLSPFTGKLYSIDVSEFLNQNGILFRPNQISIIDQAYLLLNLDILDINMSILRPENNKVGL